MCLLSRRGCGSILLLLIFFLSQVAFVSAAESSTGSIVVTGSVPPKASSILTQFSVVPPTGDVGQDQILNYTFTYSSSNSTSVPITLQIEWEKGKVAGASEGNVDTVKYVLGSASSAYGVTPAVIDTVNKRITWEVPSLPAGVGTQSVTFQLKTTASYTGPLKVSIPVSGKVLLPSGVSDKKLITNYSYRSVNGTAAESTPTPAPTPNATPTLKTSPSPSAATAPSLTTSKNVTAVLIRSIGMGSAKISVKTDSGANVAVAYGDSPTNLATTINSVSATENHEIYITNLSPNSEYYFTVLPTGKTVASDIFIFKTATEETVGAARKATSVTVSQDKSVIYSGDTAGESDQAVLPMVVMQNSVIDLFLNIPSSKEILNFEVEIRPQSVLGESTEIIETDDLQSLTTKVTQISDGVYVGKVRTPVGAGQYSMVSRIEDIYGNLSEEEIGWLIVTNPMSIVNKKNGKPIERAQIDLWMYNQQTRLFEVLSNVTNSIANPAYSNKDGAVDLHLISAKYLAKVSASGYQPQEVEFEVGAVDIQNFPRIELEPTRTPFGPTFGNISRILSSEWSQFIELYQERSQSLTLYNLVISIHLGLIIVCSSKLWRKRKTERLLIKLHRFVLFGVTEIVIFSMNFYVLNGIILSLFFIDNIGLIRGLVAATLSLFLTFLWVKLLWKEETQV